MLNAADYRQIAMLHVEHLGAGFLASLGTEFLTRFYRYLYEDKNST